MGVTVEDYYADWDYPPWHSVTISWTVPNNNGRPITNYYIEWTSNGGTGPSGGTWANSTTTSFTTSVPDRGYTFSFRVLAANAAGNGSYSVASDLLVCPFAYAKVKPSTTYGTSEFCVAQFEMKNVGGVATSQQSALPWVNISRDGAVTACRNLGSRYDLITNAQWQVTAREIENRLENWSNYSQSGTNYINRGHSDGVPNSRLAVTDGSDPCNGTGQTSCESRTSAHFAQKRTHTLKHGQDIWDLAGNVWEWVLDDNNAAQGVDTFVALETGWDATDKYNWGPEGTYTYKTSTGQYGGLGRARLNGSGGAIARGDYFNESANYYSGVFASALLYGPSAETPYFGFRCVLNRW